MLEVNKVYCGDALEVLKQIEDESIDMVITSPPYWSLRNYYIEGQIGLEPTPKEYIDKLFRVTAEIKRVLKSTGSFWLNIADCYGEEDKCLQTIPERLTIRMIDEQGWILRNKIIWCKQLLLSKENYTVGSVMPSSVKDRFNESWEYLFFFVKSKKYYSNLDAVKIPCQVVGVTDLRPPGIMRQSLYPNSKYILNPDYGGQEFQLKKQDCMPGQYANLYNGFNQKWKERFKNSKYRSPEEEKQFRQGMHVLRGQGIVEKRYNLPPQKEFVDKLRANFTIEELVEKTGLPRTTVEHWFRYDEEGFSYPSKEDWEKVGEKGRQIFPELLEVVYETDAIGKNSLYRNIPTVWQINPEPHNFRKELGIDVEHFAIFPRELVIRPIKFATKPGDIVLDPFCGSGTTLIVAKELRRRYIGIDLNPDYVRLAKLRLSKVLVQRSLDEFDTDGGKQ